MLQTIVNLDQQLFLLLNGLHNPVFDSLMLFVSYNKYFMLLLLTAVSVHGFIKFKKLYFGIFFALLISFGLSDSISSKILKPSTKRLRPCHEEMLKEKVHLAGQKCWGGKYGFVSSHASNTFAIAFFLVLIFKLKIYYSLLGYAALVSYSRVYLAKHYPLDIICGAMLGLLISYLIYRLFRILPVAKNHGF